MIKGSHQLANCKFIGFDWKSIKPSIEHEADDLRNVLFTSNRDLIKRIENKFIEEKVEALMTQRVEEELECRREYRQGKSGKSVVPPLDMEKVIGDDDTDSAAQVDRNNIEGNPWNEKPMTVGEPKRPLRPKPSGPSLVSIRSKKRGSPRMLIEKRKSLSARDTKVMEEPRPPLGPQRPVTSRSTTGEKSSIVNKIHAREKGTHRQSIAQVPVSHEELAAMSIEDRLVRCKEILKQHNMIAGVKKYKAFLLSNYDDSRLPRFMVDLEDEPAYSGEKDDHDGD